MAGALTSAGVVILNELTHAFCEETPAPRDSLGRGAAEALASALVSSEMNRWESFESFLRI